MLYFYTICKQLYLQIHLYINNDTKFWVFINRQLIIKLLDVSDELHPFDTMQTQQNEQNHLSITQLPDLCTSTARRHPKFGSSFWSECEVGMAEGHNK